MIIEGIVTTLRPDRTANVAPMGPQIDSSVSMACSSLVLRPFQTSQTYRNLKALGEGVFHVTDDVLLLAQATIEKVTPATVPATAIRGQRLADCCRYYEFRVTAWDEPGPRASLHAQVVHQGRLRDFLGFNRAKHAVLEGAIFASRIDVLPREQILVELQRLRPIVEKTGGDREMQAFEMLATFVKIAEPSNRKRDCP